MNKTNWEPCEKICPVCGKPFVPAPLHIYKIKGGQKVCSYKCRCEYEKFEEAKKEDEKKTTYATIK